MQGVIFDFDGPIFDGRGASHKALTMTFDQFEASVGRPNVAVDTLPLYGPAALIAVAYSEFPDAAEQLPTIRNFYNTVLRECERETKVDNGVRSLLRDLKGRGIKCAILSSRQTAELVNLLTDLGLHDAFDEVWGRDATSRPKPDPAAVKELVETMDVAPASFVFVGDSDRDYDATVDTGVTYYHAAWTGEPTGRAHLGCRMLLRSIEDMAAVLRDIPRYNSDSHQGMPANLVEAIRVGRQVFYAGAGVSVPSGVGGWDDHYLPIMQQLQVGPWVDDFEFPELLQLVAANSTRSKEVYRLFKQSFADREPRPNAYHYAMIRSGASHIWTTNYDQLFESALACGGFPHRVVKNDRELLENFEDRHLVVKMNGDFEHSNYADNLDWGMVFLEEQFDLAERRHREVWRLFEDDYRSASIVFVGASFKDPALRRLLSNAAKAIPRTRFRHHLLVKAAEHPADRVVESMHVENLKRVHIDTHLFRDFGDIERWVQQVTVIANRPIVGFSGSGKQENGKLTPDGVLAHGTITTQQIGDLCQRLGRALVRRGFRVSSGHGPGVGVPSVEAAFEENPTAARFYLRQHGRSRFSRTAPAVVVSGQDLAAMRERFVGELDLLVAIGGHERGRDKSGTEIEIEMALEQSIPVVVVQQGGGNAGRSKPVMMKNLDRIYSDSRLAEMVRKVNVELDAITPEDLLGYVNSNLVDRIEDLIAVSLGASVRRTADDESMTARQKW